MLNKTFKVIFKIYLSCCFILFISALILKFTIYHFASEGKLFQLFTVCALGQWAPLVILTGIEGVKGENYIKNNYRKEYEEMNTVFGISGIMNESKWKEFLKSIDDPIIEDLKKNALALKNTSKIIMFELVIVFFLIMVL